MQGLGPWLLALLRLCGPGVRPHQLPALETLARQDAVERAERARAMQSPPVRPDGPAVRMVGLDGAETGHFVAGGARVDVTRGEVRVARERLQAAVVAVARVRDGWVFVGADGTIVRSDTFTGSLRVLDAAPRGFAVPPGSAGRLCVRDRCGVWWSTDGHGPLARLGTPLTVAFATERLGARVLDGGGLEFTTDGGARWRPVDLGTRAAIAVEGSVRGLQVRVSDGMHTLTEEGTLEAAIPRVEQKPAAMAYPGDGAVQRAAGGAVALFQTVPSGERCVPPERMAVPARSSSVWMTCQPGRRTLAPLGDDPWTLVRARRGAVAGPVRAAVVRQRGQNPQEADLLRAFAWRSDAGDAVLAPGTEATAGVTGLTAALSASSARVLVTTREGVVLDDGGTALSWVPRVGTARRLSEAVLSGSSDALPEEDAVALPDGGFVRLVRQTVHPVEIGDPTAVIPRELDGAWLARVERWDATGARVALRWVTWPMVERGVALGRFRGRWGVALGRRWEAGGMDFVPMDGGGLVDGLPPGTDAAVSMCPYPPVDDALTVSLSTSAASARVHLADRHAHMIEDQRVELEFGAAGACVRRWEAVIQAESQPPETWWLDARPRGELAGVGDDGVARRTVSCSTLAPVGREGP